MTNKTTEKTTITLSKGTKKKLDALKTHPRQGYEEVVVKLLYAYFIFQLITARQGYEEVVVKLLEERKTGTETEKNIEDLEPHSPEWWMAKWGEGAAEIDGWE